MTKRFYLLNYNNFPIYDSLNDKEYNAQFKKQRENLCELLNEQHEQIQELIQSSKELEEDCQSTFNAMNRKQNDLYRKNFKLKEENEQLKSQLRIYRKIASCSNCDYHDYDEFDNNDGSYDEFEVCRKGNDVTERICKEWRKL